MPNYKILFISHTPDSGVFKVGSHHLARELSKLSHRVAHVSTPSSLVHKATGRRKMNTGRHGVVDEFGTRHVVPNVLLPIQLNRGSKALQRLVTEIGFYEADFVLIDQPLMSGLVTGSQITGKVVYRPTDTYSTAIASKRQAEVLVHSHGVVATSESVLNALPEYARRLPSMVLTNGVELSRFQVTRSEERSGFVYIGAVDYRFDWEIILALAQAYPDEKISIVGPVTVNREGLPTNVSVIGSIPYAEIPSTLAGARVGLIPLNNSSVNQGRSPMKYYEYLAAGLTVVATSTESLRERSSAQTFLFRTPREAVEAARLALAMPSPNSAGMAEAMAQDWSGKARSLLDFLGNL